MTIAPISKVWQHALDDCGFVARLAPRRFQQQQQELSAFPCDTYSLWDGALERVYDAGDHKIGLGVYVDTKQAGLAIWLFDGNDEDLTAGLEPGEDWQPELNEGYRYTLDELARFSNDGCCIPLDPLNLAASRALQSIRRILGG